MIIDSHVHIGGNSATFEMSEDDVLYAIEKYKIDKVLVSNADSVECDSSHKLLPPELQVSEYNSAVRTINFARDNKGVVYAALWLRPATEKLKKQFTDLVTRNLDVVKALKVHPFYSSLKFNDSRLIEYIELAKRLNLPIIVHTASDQYSNPEYVAEVARRYPTVKFILAHMELESNNERAISLCANTDNLYADTAWVETNSTLNFIQRCSSERLLFGSDMPIDGPDTYSRNRLGVRSLYQDYFFELPKHINEKDYENIMYRNAERIFGM